MTRYRKAKIVIIDDSDIVLELAKEALQAAGYHVLTHNRPRGSIALMLQEEPDLVLIDVNMPGVDGDTLVRCFAAARRATPITILLHSGIEEAELAARTEASGADGFIRKRENPASLVQEVQRWLSAQVESVPSIPAPPPVSASSQGSGRNVPLSFEADRYSSGTRRLQVYNVLLIGSEMAALAHYRRQLECSALAFDFALSADHGLSKLLGSGPPDVVVTEVAIGGLTLYQRMFASDQSWRQRFVFISEQADLQIPGFFGAVLSRPTNQDALRRAVDDAIRAFRTHRRATFG